MVSGRYSPNHVSTSSKSLGNRRDRRGSPGRCPPRHRKLRTEWLVRGWSVHPFSYCLYLIIPCGAAQPRIDEATLVAVQHQMAQQAAFSQIPDAVKRVRVALSSWSKTKAHHLILFFRPVYRSLPSSSLGKQPCRDNGGLRKRLEPTH